MNPETEKNINEAIDWLQSTGGSIQDFASEQAPLYCQEVVQWELWSSAVGAAAGLLLLIGIPFSAYLNRRKIVHAIERDEFHTVLAWTVAGAVALGAGLPLSFDNVPNLIKALTAPRIVIVEHLRGLKP
jgi:hypothetical protein